MTETRFYSTKREREKLIKEQRALGLSALHDDFVTIEGKETKGDSGRLIFDVIPENTEQAQKLLLEQDLKSKLKDNTITFEETKELLRLKFNL